MQTNQAPLAEGQAGPPASAVVVELRPYSFRIPANGEQDPWFGCARTFWAERIRETPTKPADVRSFVLRRSPDKRGIRLIDYESARAYIERERVKAETQFNLLTEEAA